MPSSLLSVSGERKYLNAEERSLVLDHARSTRGDIGLFCWALLETGCRISEALALGYRNVDLSQRAIIFESLKKRRRGVFRVVPVSDELIACLDRHFGISEAKASSAQEARLWRWSRTTGYRHVRAMMATVGIKGGHASAKGMRHGFGVAAVSASIPLNLLQRWLGHADMKTTAIYANASGPEERWIASRLWSGRTGASGNAPEQNGAITYPCRNCPALNAPNRPVIENASLEVA